MPSSLISSRPSAHRCPHLVDSHSVFFSITSPSTLLPFSIPSTLCPAANVRVECWYFLACFVDESTVAVVGRLVKRVRAGSPGSGGGSYPMYQVDDCRTDLTGAKDYHRRHKVLLHFGPEALKKVVGR